MLFTHPPSLSRLRFTQTTWPSKCGPLLRDQTCLPSRGRCRRGAGPIRFDRRENRISAKGPRTVLISLFNFFARQMDRRAHSRVPLTSPAFARSRRPLPQLPRNRDLPVQSRAHHGRVSLFFQPKDQGMGLSVALEIPSARRPCASVPKRGLFLDPRIHRGGRIVYLPRTLRLLHSARHELRAARRKV